MTHSKGNEMDKRETAALAGGCFWCLEAVFLELKGVEKVVSGYSGGAVERPSYHEVSTGTTGHAEAVQVIFNPEKISFKHILEVFFTIHDPTTLNRQGADVGTQYRSAIFFHSDEQKTIAEQMKQELDRTKTWEHPIVTEITPFQNFYPAEDYHQDYYEQNRGEPYCRIVIEPKIAKLRKHFIDKLKK
jgi:peptide-methionine (S)-S-oxide reductase